MKRIIKVGDSAPVIQSTDIWGNTMNIPSKGEWIYLSFHRFAACPFCNLRTNQLIHQYGNFQKLNVEVVSIWPSDKDSLLRHAGKDKAPFPMVSDQNKHIYRSYGVTESSVIGAFKLMLHPQLMWNAIKNKHNKIEVDADPKLLPASFLINPEGIIKMAYYGEHYGDHPKIDTILQFIK